MSGLRTHALQVVLRHMWLQVYGCLVYTASRLALRLNPGLGLGLVDWHEYAAQPNGWIRAVPWMRLNMESPEDLLDSSVEPVE